jgi:hypothetical protein
MLVRITLEATISLPDGTRLPEQGRAFTLPNGDWVKPFVVLERNDWQDLSHSVTESLGIYLEDGVTTIEELEG